MDNTHLAHIHHQLEAGFGGYNNYAILKSYPQIVHHFLELGQSNL